MFVTGLGLFLLSTMGTATEFWQAAIYMIVTGAGLGMVMQVLILAVQNAVEVRDLGVGTSTVTFLRSLGGAFGVSVAGAIFTNRLATYLADRLPPGTTLGGANGSVGGPDQIALLPPDVQADVIASVAAAIGDVYLYAVPVALVGFALAWLLYWIPW
jgi:hypothetical protein